MARPPCPGRLVLDPTSHPNWKMCCNAPHCNVIVLFKHVIKVTQGVDLSKHAMKAAQGVHLLEHAIKVTQGVELFKHSIKTTQGVFLFVRYIVLKVHVTRTWMQPESIPARVCR